MGIGESIKGTVKEKLGKVTEDDELRTEGKAQHAKGDEETRETERRAEAKAHEDKAEALRRREESLREGT